MITKIKLHNTATYSNPIELTELPKINFFFGSNGTGKTTISKLLANPDSYPSCQVKWQNEKLKTIVYNEDFVRRVFYQSENLPGIFTMGEEAKDIEEKIKQKNDAKEQLNKEKNQLNATLENKNIELQKKENNFRELCWKKIFEKYNETFNKIFDGYRKSKEKLANYILNQFSKNQSELKDIKDINFLKERYNLLYNEELKTISEIIQLTDDIYNQLKNLESNQILKTKIIGKDDIDIAKMIEKLHNHDWVRQGKEYYEQNFDKETNSYICPFCQQKTTDDFKIKLEEYFDETYNNQIKEVNQFKNSYSEITAKIGEYFDKLIAIEGNKYFEREKEKIKTQIQIIHGILSENQLLINKKIDKPSESVEIKSIIKEHQNLKELITIINNEIVKHNNIVNNQDKEKQTLNSEIWKYFCVDIKNDIESYKKEKENIEKAINNLTDQINAQEIILKKSKMKF